MRCHYMSDLHLEGQEFPWRLPKGDVLILAGDLAHAACLDPARKDPYAMKQRERVLRFIGEAVRNFTHVLLIAGNHDHYDGVFQDTVPTLRRCLPGVTVLDDEMVEIGGVSFFGTTLWSDFEGRKAESLERARRGVGEFFFVKTRGSDGLRKFQPADAVAAHERGVAALKTAMAGTAGKPVVVVSHHAPSLKGLNPTHAGNGLDGAYASDLDGLVATFANVPVWVHGHTHIKKTYRIGDTIVRANCRGFEKQGGAVKGFSVAEAFDVS
jgi:Icc-related predicted phosphoesterase